MRKPRPNKPAPARAKRPGRADSLPDKRLDLGDKSLLRDLVILAAILLVGVGLRALYLGEIKDEPDFAVPAIDAGFHDYWARALATGDWTPPPGSSDPKIRTTPYLRPPGYPYFLALIYEAVGLEYAAPRIVQMSLGLISAVLAFLIGRRWYGRGVGLTWAALMSVYWVFIYFEGEFHEPALLISLLLGVVGLVGLWGSRLAPAYLVCAGVVVGLAALVRPNVLVFIPVIMAWAGLVAQRRQDWRAVHLAVPGFIAGAALAVAPATIRNLRAAGDFVLVSCNSGINLYIGNNETATGRVADEIPGLGEFGTCYDYPALVAALEARLGRSLKYSEASAYFAGQAWRFIREHPLDFLKLTATKTLLFWGPYEIAHNKAVEYQRRFSPVLRSIPGNFALVAALGLLGLLMMAQQWKRRRAATSTTTQAPPGHWEVSLLVLALAGAYFLSVLPFFVSARYRVPVIPFVLLFGAYAVSRVAHLLRVRNLRGGVAWVAAGVGFYLLAGASATDSPADLGKWHCDRGLAYYRRGRLDAAINEYRQAIQADPNSKMAHINLASAFSEQGALDEAISHSREALRLSPNVAALHNNLGITLAKAGRSDEAIEQYHQALRLKPDLVEVRYNLAVLLTAAGRTTEAIAQLNEVLQIRPDAPQAHYHLGRAFAAQGNVEQAIAWYTEALQLKPDYADAHYHLAKALVTQNRLPEAVVAYKAALRVNPAHAGARGDLDRVQRALRPEHDPGRPTTS